MAVLAVAGLGALGSSALGLGWQAGWLLGSTVGSLLFNKTPNQEVPRLSDLTVTSSAYGAPIPIGYGVLSADELQNRIYLLTSKEAGRDY